MLSKLPVEIIYLIATYLPSASDLVHIAQTCKRLYGVVSAEDGHVFRAFIEHRFPGFVPSSCWKDVTQALTSRSRALDKNAVVSRFVAKPPTRAELGITTRTDRPTLGYRPAIDSYEIWNGSTWADRREVLAWGGGHEIVMKIKQHGKAQNSQWAIFDDLDVVSSHDDVCGLHILRPGHHRKVEDKEHIIFGRMRGELLHVALKPNEDTHDYVQRFQTSNSGLEHIDLSEGPDPILAAHDKKGTITFYSTTKDDDVVEPFGNIVIGSRLAARNKCSKFLSPTLFAIGTGRSEDALAISSISSERLALEREISVGSLDQDVRLGSTASVIVNAMAPLCGQQVTTGSPGSTFLAAWGDRRIRLHDVRSNRASESTYKDPTDQSQIYSLHPFGHDRFLAGAGADAVVKIFDLRMPKTYSYTDSRASSIYQHNVPRRKASGGEIAPPVESIRYPRKDFSMFLFYAPPLYPNAPRRRQRESTPYRGAIYSLCSPSPLSPTVYAGITDGVVRLDFMSTDDLTGSCGDWYREMIDIDLEIQEDRTTYNPERVLDLSGYERPEPDDTTTTSPLRTQKRFAYIDETNIKNEQLTGWDRRWNPMERFAAWRRRD
ncbi:hypothetical protein OAory_01058800 [Aspergillus oryzae]|uniref:F-box domain-containing protein n=1 Tax=Aspergillus oryzae TaxID=5062 RepID=A0A1S9DLX3_ASPOZ|nr:hypothetical protein OAory_01058800 [Aspergillus oryzae]